MLVVLMLALFLQTVFFLNFSISCNFLVKVRHDVMINRKIDKWAFSVRFYIYLVGVRLCLMLAISIGVRGFNLLQCLYVSSCLCVSLEAS